MAAEVDILRAFERAQRRRGLRPRTVDARIKALRRIEGDLGRRAIDLTTDDIEEWLDGCRINLRSRSIYISNLGAFYGWAVVADHRVDDPTTRIPRPKLAKKLPRPIDDGDLDVALRMATPRMRAWLVLACYQGLRCMEIAQLAREDVLDRHRPALLRVLDGKGGREGLLPLHPEVLDALGVYGMPQTGPIFMSVRGRAFSPTTISGYVADYLHDLGLHDTAHRLRDWFGTAVYAGTKDLRLTQEMMRHADPASTASYVAFDSTSAVEAIVGLAAGRHQHPALF